MLHLHVHMYVHMMCYAEKAADMMCGYLPTSHLINVLDSRPFRLDMHMIHTKRLLHNALPRIYLLSVNLPVWCYLIVVQLMGRSGSTAMRSNQPEGGASFFVIQNNSCRIS